VKVIILTAQAPFIRGGAEYLADALRQKLEARGHRVEIVQIPFKWYPAESIPRHMLACRLLQVDAGDDADLVIAMKFPAYLAPCRRKKLWLLHQFRQVYELWGTPYQDLPDTPEGRRVRDMVIRADDRYLREADEIYTNSRIVAERLRTYNGIEATGVLYPPLLSDALYRAGDFGDYFFYPSRLSGGKRQALAIEAMRHARPEVRLILAGRPDSAEYGAELAGMIDRYGLRDRVTMLGWISDEAKAELMAGARGVLYIPYDEDSYGFVTLEAFSSHKPVVTMTDSGGVDELVQDGVNGMVVEPDARRLAAALDELWGDRARAGRMGARARETLRERNISWDYVLERLLA